MLFNPGVHFLQDPRTGVYNFSKELGNLPNIDDFEMEKLPKYVISSEDEVLGDMAKELGKSFVSSTSSSVGMLCQVRHFTLSSVVLQTDAEVHRFICGYLKEKI